MSQSSTQSRVSSNISPWIRDTPYYPFSRRTPLTHEILRTFDPSQPSRSGSVNEDLESYTSSCPSSPSVASSAWSLSDGSTDLSSISSQHHSSVHKLDAGHSTARRSSASSSYASYISYSTLPTVYKSLANTENRPGTWARRSSTPSRPLSSKVALEDNVFPVHTRGRSYRVFNFENPAKSSNTNAPHHSRRSSQSKRNSKLEHHGSWRPTKLSRSRSHRRCHECLRELPLAKVPGNSDERATSPFRVPYELEVRKPKRSSSRDTASSAERFADRFGEVIGLWAKIRDEKPARSTESKSRKRRYSVMR